MDQEYIDKLTIKQLKQLAAYEAPLCLTLTMPCVKAGDQQQQNPIRFKNLMREATGKLEKIGWKERKINEFLEPVKKLLMNYDFWIKQGEGLIVCLSHDVFTHYRLPYPLEVNVLIDRHFYLRPIIPHMLYNKDIALFLLNRENSQFVFLPAQEKEPEVHHPPKPLTSFDEFIEGFEQQKALQSRGQGHEGGKYAVNVGFHGHGAAGDEDTQNRYLLEYFKQLEDWLTDELAKKECDEVFCVAEPHEEGLYHSIMRDAHPRWRLLAHKIPQSEDLEHWIGEARKMLNADLEEKRESSLSAYERMKNGEGNKVVEDVIPEIVKAAYNQRIDMLLVPDKSHDYFWGRFDPQMNEVEEQELDERYTGPGDELINLAVIQTFLNGGEIIALPGSRFPHYAALCRW